MSHFFQFVGDLLCFKIWNIALPGDEIDPEIACHDGRPIDYSQSFLFQRESKD